MIVLYLVLDMADSSLGKYDSDVKVLSCSREDSILYDIPSFIHRVNSDDSFHATDDSDSDVVVLPFESTSSSSSRPL
jgi:hypothetical protein